MSASGQALLEEYRMAEAAWWEVQYEWSHDEMREARDPLLRHLLTLKQDAALLLRNEALRRLACEAVLSGVRQDWIAGRH